jgi:hypothetical protein
VDRNNDRRYQEFKKQKIFNVSFQKDESYIIRSSIGKLRSD